MPKPRKPAEKALLTCPFTGAPIETVRTDSGHWLGRVAVEGLGGYVTQLFDSRTELVFFLSTRDGVRPNLPQRIHIEVRDREPPPPDPVAAEMEQQEELSEAVDAVVDEAIDRVRRTGRVSDNPGERGPAGCGGHQ